MESKSSSNFDILIIIPVYNDYHRLDKCLVALTEQVGNINFEVSVVDNGSSFIDQDMIKKYKSFSNITFLSESKAGSYAARNKALKSVSSQYIAFTDSDCIPAPNWLVNLLITFNETQCDLIAGNVVVFSQDISAKTLLETYETVLAFPQKENAKLGRSVTANLAITKEVIDKIGTFDDETFSGADHEFTQRAVKAGFTLVYGENCCISHPARKQLKEMRHKLRRTVGGFYKLSSSNVDMENKLTWFAILKDLAPPFNAFREVMERNDELSLTVMDVLKVLLVSVHNKWYRMWLKIQLKLGFTSFIER